VPAAGQHARAFHLVRCAAGAAAGSLVRGFKTGNVKQANIMLVVGEPFTKTAANVSGAGERRTHVKTIGSDSYG